MSSSNEPPKPKSKRPPIQKPKPRPASTPTITPPISMSQYNLLKQKNSSKLPQQQPPKPVKPQLSPVNEVDTPTSSSASIPQVFCRVMTCSTKTNKLEPETDHEHKLKPCSALEDLFECGACELKCRSKRRECTTCNKQFHTECLTFKKTEVGHEHKHELRKYNKIYNCNGCKNDGFGKRFRCDQCGHELHKLCMFPEDTHRVEWLNRLFKFHNREKESGEKLVCDACTNDIEGYYYKKDGLDLHPCCMLLEHKIFAEPKEENSSKKDEIICVPTEKDERIYTLVEKVKSKTKCCLCDRSRLDNSDIAGGWSYVCDDETHCYHVHCLQEVACEAWRTANGRDLDDKTLAEFIDMKLTKRKRSESSSWRIASKIFKVILKMLLSILTGDPTFGFAQLALSLASG